MIWQPIETCPRDGTLVILFCPETEGVTTGSWILGDGDCWPEHGWIYNREVLRPQDEKFAPTHWMSLPEPPR